MMGGAPPPLVASQTRLALQARPIVYLGPRKAMQEFGTEFACLWVVCVHVSRPLYVSIFG